MNLERNESIFQRIYGLYSLMQDEESKYIFRQRLLYSLSGDEKHIYEMVTALIEKCGDEDAFFQLRGWLKGQSGKKTVIFGAGCACWNLLHILHFCEIKVDYICDNNRNLWGQTSNGKTVISPEELRGLRDQVCVIVGTNWYQQEIFKQLLDLGMERDHVFIPPHAWWIGGAVQYFDPEIMIPGRHEVFVDGGAFAGEDTVEFTRWCDNKYDAVYVFEPDPANYERVCARLEMFPADRKTVLNRGLWSSETELRFSAGEGGNSHMDSQGAVSILTAAVDEVLDGPATFIKMDIEGSELEALKGAAKTIREYKPKLAICVYHKPEDILDIPDYIYSLCPDYRFYLRHYSYADTETVLYAV